MSKHDFLTDVAREGLKNPNFSPEGEEQDVGENDFTNATNDISKGARDTLAIYLSSKTKDKKNAYPISDEEVLLSPNARGTDLSAPSSAQAHFSSGSTNQTRFFKDLSGLSSVLSKTAQNPDLTGDRLLSSIPEETTSPVSFQQPFSKAPAEPGRGNDLLRLIHQQLVAENMYSPDESDPDHKPFLQNPGGKNEEEITRGLFSIQRNLGSFNAKGERVQVSDMSAIAMASLLRAAGHEHASDTVLNEKSLADIGKWALVPFARGPQLGATGQGIDAYRLRTVLTANGPAAELAKSATGQDSFIIPTKSSSNLVTKGIPPNNDDLPNIQSSPHNAASYAQLNTFLEPFSVGARFSSVSMFTLAVAGVTAMILTGLVIGALANIGGQNLATQKSDPRRPSTLTFGKRQNVGAFQSTVNRLLMITQTDYEFGDCLGRGIPLLYGFEGGIGIAFEATMLLEVAENIVLSGGYYANFTRNLIAEATNVVNIFAKVGTNSTQGIEGVLAGIDALLSSAVYKFMMVAAGVGDAALKSERGMVDVDSTQRALENVVIDPLVTLQPSIKGSTSADKKGPDAQLGIFRNQRTRWGGDSRRNALSLTTFLATQKTGAAGLPADAHPDTVINRFLAPSRDNVKLIEDALEAEYMPFYMHDLRTHEVMSFPAFITEFGETFAPSYNAVEGIGRQDPIRLHSKTERQVNFGFMLVAHSKEDHDLMWLAINKLIAMCYPQYSAGRLRKGKDGKQFIQPFSQVQAASPMIRLRLADVFKSNYSKYGLSRLFGVASSKLASEESKDTQSQEIRDTRDAAINDLKSWQSLKSLPVGTPLTLKNVVKAIGVDGKPLMDPVSITQPLANPKQVEIPAGEVVILSAPLPATKKDGKNVSVTLDFLATSKSSIAPYRVSIADIQAPSADVVKTLANLAAAAQIAAAALTDNTMPDSDFFSSGDKGNSIVRSFESTRGRGVAGFITNLGLDYGMGNYPWETEPGNRAPMVVKISLGFAPITDLPLGLDYDGEIRNPSHPVGKFAGGHGDVYSEFADGNTNKSFFGIRPKALTDVNSEINRSIDREGAINKLPKNNKGG